MTTLTREAALALAPVFVEAVREHSSNVLASLTDEHKAQMHPQALADLSALSSIEGQFCDVWPNIDKTISSLGLIVKMFFAQVYAFALTLQTIGEKIAEVLCPAKVKKAVT